MKESVMFLKRYTFLGMLLLGGVIYLIINYREPLYEAWQEAMVRLEKNEPEDTEMIAETIGTETEDTETIEKTDAPAESADEPVEFETVDESYFDDALIIGDSRAVGLYEYAQMDNAEFYVSSGMNIYKVFEDPTWKMTDGNWPQNLRTTLSEKQYGKIYLILGINEMGVGDVDYFIKNYGEVIEEIRMLQPDAIIFIHGILRVTEERSEKGDYITNAGIDERNRRLKEFADNRTIFYLDVNELFCDETGALNPELSNDGVHLYAQYIASWKEYLLAHGINIK